jgi:hypothetical protein
LSVTAQSADGEQQSDVGLQQEDLADDASSATAEDLLDVSLMACGEDMRILRTLEVYLAENLADRAGGDRDCA